MKLIDKISAIKISDISHDEIKYWLMEEVTDLCMDMGQKLVDEQKDHIPNRLFYILIDKYRNWEPGKIHSIFQKGITGAYGSKSMKLTVSLILSWITQEDRLLRGENVQNYFNEDEKIPESEKERFREVGKRCVPFIRFCHERSIDISCLSLDEYRKLRDRFNRGGEIEIMADISNLPQYKNFGISNFIMLR